MGIRAFCVFFLIVLWLRLEIVPSAPEVTFDDGIDVEAAVHQFGRAECRIQFAAVIIAVRIQSPQFDDVERRRRLGEHAVVVQQALRVVFGNERPDRLVFLERTAQTVEGAVLHKSAVLFVARSLAGG